MVRYGTARAWTDGQHLVPIHWIRRKLDEQQLLDIVLDMLRVAGQYLWRTLHASMLAPLYSFEPVTYGSYRCTRFKS